MVNPDVHLTQLPSQNSLRHLHILANWWRYIYWRWRMLGKILIDRSNTSHSSLQIHCGVATLSFCRHRVNRLCDIRSPLWQTAQFKNNCHHGLVPNGYSSASTLHQFADPYSIHLGHGVLLPWYIACRTLHKMWEYTAMQWWPILLFITFDQKVCGYFIGHVTTLDLQTTKWHEVKAGGHFIGVLSENTWL